MCIEQVQVYLFKQKDPMFIIYPVIWVFFKN